jgi:hypothetical protein
MSIASLYKNPPSASENIFVNSISANEFIGLTGATGNFNNIVCNTITATTGTFGEISGSTGLFITLDVNHTPSLPYPASYFTCFTTLTGTGTSCYTFETTDSGFNNPYASILAVTAPNTHSYELGTNFIMCINGLTGATGFTGATGIPGGVFLVASDGTVGCKTTVNWSSMFYKKNVQVFKADSKLVRNLNPCHYHMLEENEDNPKNAGLIYEELKDIAPEICKELPFQRSKGIDVYGLCALQMAIIKDLEQRLSVLEIKQS